MRHGRELCRACRALERARVPRVASLALGEVEHRQAVGERARGRHAEARLGGERAEQMLFGRHHHVQRGTGNGERALDPARKEGILARGRRASLGVFGGVGRLAVKDRRARAATHAPA
jgi:hypothetical protein